MYATGINSAVAVMRSAGFLAQVAGTAVILLAIIVVVRSFIQKSSKDAPPSVPGHTLSHILPFFYRRFDFLTTGRSATGESVYKFNLLQKTVVVVTGESARQAFFSAKGLDLSEGFKILSGAIPMVKGATSGIQHKRVLLIHKRLAQLQRHDSLSELIPPILADIRNTMESWGGSGRFDPFDDVYYLFFQLAVRTLSCSEIADDPVMVKRLKNLYDTLDEATTPTSVLLPWFPSPSMVRKLAATKKIYDIVDEVLNARIQSGVYRKDTLQMLLDNGDERLVCIGFIMGLLIAGAKASGTAACWLLILLGGYPEWREKAKVEMESLVATHATPGLATTSLSSALASIPLDVWENNTPVLDSVIREMLRVSQPHTAMRQNLGPEMHIDGKRIRTGDYVIYPFYDVHLNPDIYPEPHKFDPSRREEIKSAYGYIGWGAGKTPCAGTRMAKVELKLVAAMLLLGFEHRIVDSQGKVPDVVPGPNWNDTLIYRPAKGTCDLEYRRTSIPL